MIYNIDYDVAALCFLTATLLYHMIMFRNAHESSRAFSYMIQACILFTVCDIATCYTISYGEQLARWVNIFVNTLYFASEVLAIYMFLYYAKKNSNLPPSGGIMILLDYGLLIVFMGLLLLNVKYQFIFDVDTNGIYHTGQYFFIAPLVGLYYFFYSAFVFLYGTNRTGRQIFSFLSFILFGIAGIMAQWVWFPKIMLVSFGLSIATLIMLLALETPDYQKLKETMEQLNYAKEDALLAAQAKDRFLANMSHELRTPINAVIGMDEMILRESKEKHTIEYAENIKKASSSLLQLLNDLLDFSKIENDKLELLPDEYSLDEMITSVVLMTLPRAQEKSLKFDVSADPNIPNHLYGDEVRIKQCILNLVTNAIKYTSNGGVEFRVTYDIDAKSKDYIYLIVTVKDSGQGMKKEEMNRLFVPFERLNERQNHTVEGTGLGMSITKRLLGMMDSTLEVDSKYQEGSTFSFRVRQMVMNDAPIGDYNDAYHRAKKKRKEYTETFVAPNARILAVDDVPMNLTLLIGLLKKTQIQIDTTVTGAEAVAMAKEKHYDLFLIDHMMPIMNGSETMQHLREDAGVQSRNAPIIVLTANAVHGAKEKYLEAGFTDYLSKPVDAQALEEMLMRYLPSELVSKSIIQDDEEIEFDTTLQIINRIPSISLMEGIQNSGGVDLYEQVCKEFYDTIDYRADLLEDYEINELFKDYAIQVHALKSSARLIGAMKLSKLAEEAEEMANNEEKQQSIHVINKFIISAYRDLKDQLAIAFENSKCSEAISEDELTDDLKTIYEAMEEFEFDDAEHVMESLDKHELPDTFKPVYNKLKVLMAEVKRDEILEVIESYLTRR